MNKDGLIVSVFGVNNYLEQKYDTDIQYLTYDEDGFVDLDNETIDIHIPYKPIYSAGGSICEYETLAEMLKQCERQFETEEHGFDAECIEKFTDDGIAYFDMHFIITSETTKDDIINFLDTIHSFGVDFIYNINDYMGNVSQDYLNKITSGEGFGEAEQKLIVYHIDEYTFDGQYLDDLIPDIEDKIKAEMIKLCKDMPADTLREIVEQAYDKGDKNMTYHNFFKAVLYTVDVDKMRYEALEQAHHDNYFDR